MPLSQRTFNVEALGRFFLIQDITFENDTGEIPVFVVTGDVLIRIIPVITTDVVSGAGANIRLGVEENTEAMVVDSIASGLLSRFIWVDQTPGNNIEPVERIRAYIDIDGKDIVLNLDAQVDSGVIRFYCFWTPLSVGAVVTKT